MSLFSEIERLITEHGSAAILRERLALVKEQYEVLEKKVAELQSENQSLRKQLNQKSMGNENLKELGSKTNNFDETTHRILKYFFIRSEDIAVDELIQTSGIEKGYVEYHLDLLRKADFIYMSQFAVDYGVSSSPAMFALTAQGRKYVVENKL